MFMTIAEYVNQQNSMYYVKTTVYNCMMCLRMCVGVRVRVRAFVRACVRVWACVHNHVCIFYVIHLAAHLKRKTKPYYVRLCTLSN